MSSDKDKIKLSKRSRLLTNNDSVWDNNAWDNVTWSEEYLEYASRKVKSLSLSPCTYDYNNLRKPWDQFYERHHNKFFKDRKWILQEFYPLNEAVVSTINDEKIKIFEVGCGVGNLAFPLLEKYAHKLFLTAFHMVVICNRLLYYCCDFSEKAIEIIKSDERYTNGGIYPFVCDITDPNIVYPFEENSLDFIIAVFVLSAIPPIKLDDVIRRLSKYLKKDSGMLLFRDYGQYDLTQLRFKSTNFLQDNLYKRNDGTLTHFFTTDTLHNLLSRHNLLKIENQEDKRLIVNRSKKLKMYRNWIQAIYKNYEPCLSNKNFFY